MHPNVTQHARQQGQHHAARRAALEAIAADLRTRPLTVITDFRHRDGAIPTIALKVRPDYCGLDQIFIDATLRAGGWSANAKDRSTLNAKYDCRAVVHEETGAERCS